MQGTSSTKFHCTTLFLVQFENSTESVDYPKMIPFRHYTNAHRRNQ